MATIGARRSKKRTWFLFLLFILCIAIIATVLVDIRIRPMIKLYGSNQATTNATEAVNDAVEAVLSGMSVKYEDLATVHKDSDGKIADIETNAGNMNLLKSAVSKKILEELNEQDYQMVKIPIGSLAGGLLTGRGPVISIKVPMNSTVDTSFQNKFESAGINQTRHEITLDVKVTLFAVIQGENTSVQVDTGFTIAECVLVGEVPQWVVGTQTAQTAPAND